MSFWYVSEPGNLHRVCAHQLPRCSGPGGEDRWAQTLASVWVCTALSTCLREADSPQSQQSDLHVSLKAQREFVARGRSYCAKWHFVLSEWVPGAAPPAPCMELSPQEEGVSLGLLRKQGTPQPQGQSSGTCLAPSPLIFRGKLRPREARAGLPSGTMFSEPGPLCRPRCQVLCM